MQRYKITHEDIKDVIVMAEDENSAYAQLPKYLDESQDFREIGFESGIEKLWEGRLIPDILDEFATNEESNVKREDKLLRLYDNADRATKELIDDVFIILTGWSLDTLIRR